MRYFNPEPIFDGVLTMKRAEGWTYRQLADISGLTVGQVKTRIERYLVLHGTR